MRMAARPVIRMVGTADLQEAARECWKLQEGMEGTEMIMTEEEEGEDLDPHSLEVVMARMEAHPTAAPEELAQVMAAMAATTMAYPQTKLERMDSLPAAAEVEKPMAARVPGAGQTAR